VFERGSSRGTFKAMLSPGFSVCGSSKPDHATKAKAATAAAVAHQAQRAAL
jgi:hypothetical protein